MSETQNAHPPATFGHIPALDGLRAVAVLSVIGYHYDMFGLRGGFLGVDLFFVLSGFLITSLLITEADISGRVSLKAFWVRRFKRLMPAAIVMLIAVSIWAALKVDSMQLATVRSDFLATLGYVANWRFIYSGQSYFEQFTLASPVRHAWSLAIEEQFYVVWPLLFTIIYRVRRKWLLAAIVTTAIAASAIWMAVLFDPNNISRVYYGTDTRASQLLVGVLLAVIVSAGRLRISNLTAVALNAFSLAVVVVAMFTIADQDEGLYKGGLLAFAVITALLLFSSAQLKSGPVHFVLCSSPVQFVGRISYGLYLWHWPIQIMITDRSTSFDGWRLTAVRLVVTFVVTYISYRLIEMPLRYSKWPGWMTWRSLVILPATLAVVAAIIGASTLGATSRPAYLDANPGEVITGSTIKPLITTTTVPGDVAIGRVALMGDSLAGSMQIGMAKTAAAMGIDFVSVARPGCASIHGVAGENGKVNPWGYKCDDNLTGFLRNTVLGADAQTILWMSSWEAADRIVDGVYYKAGTPEHHQMLMREFATTVHLITSHGAKVIFLTNAPAIDYDNELQYYVKPEYRVYADNLNKLYFDFAKAHPKTSAVLDFSKIVCPSGFPCPVEIGGLRLRPRDGRHFSDEAAEFISKPMFEELQKVLNASFG